MHQFVDDHFLQVFLLRAYDVQEQDRFPVVAVDFEITCFPPRGILHKFKPYIPGRRDAQFPNVFFKQGSQSFLIHILLRNHQKIPFISDTANRLLSSGITGSSAAGVCGSVSVFKFPARIKRGNFIR